MGGACYKPGYERGPWYELKAIRGIIDSQAANGDPAEFERQLYKAWLKSPEYAKADLDNLRRGLYKPYSLFQNPEKTAPAPIIDVTDATPNIETGFETSEKDKGGRPRIPDGKPASRSTLYRRRIEAEQLGLELNYAG